MWHHYETTVFDNSNEGCKAVLLNIYLTAKGSFDPKLRLFTQALNQTRVLHNQ